MSRARKKKEDDQVEQLLQAAQDDVLLKLSLDSHTTRAAYSIDPDIDRRYEALKSHQNPKSTPMPETAAAASEGRIDGSEEEDDLFARFAALNKSIPSHDNIESRGTESRGDDDDDDDVEKVIKWAVDAARLDPSCTTSDDETDDEVEIDKRKGKKKNDRF